MKIIRCPVCLEVIPKCKCPTLTPEEQETERHIEAWNEMKEQAQAWQEQTNGG
jgi:hypothetical protein